MNDIALHLHTIRQQLPAHVQLIAVSKSRPAHDIATAWQAGQRAFAESRPQELIQKAAELAPLPVQWHFIGHLQTNKVKQVVPLAYMIHSVDSLRLLEAINTESIKLQRTTRCLLQVHVAQEETKFGFAPDELLTLCSAIRLGQYAGIAFCGLMAMASNTPNQEQVRQEFAQVRQLRNTIQDLNPFLQPSFCELSMGMSNDYLLAMEQGATLIRIGSSLFAS